MKVVAKKPGEPADIIDIGNDLAFLWNYVGGRIETVPLFDDVRIIYNEEGFTLRLPFNLSFRGMVFLGPVLFVGTEGGEFTDCPNAGWLMDQINVYNAL